MNTAEELVVRRHAAAGTLGLLGAALAVLLVGCGGANGGESKGSTAPPTGKDRHTPSHSASATPPPSRTPSPTPTPTPTPQEAKDKRNFGACRDRTCEVEVRAGDTIEFAPEFVTDTFTVEQITGEKVSFSLTDDQSGPLTGYVNGGGHVETGDIRVRFDPTDDGRTILEFKPR